MRKIIMYIISMLVFASCSESEYNTTRKPSLKRCYLQVNASALDFESNASTRTLDIEADETPWKITIPAPWAKVSKTSGNSSESVDFSVELNNSADTSRVCVANVSADVRDWERSFAITLTQAKASPYILLSETSLTIDGKKQSKTIEINSNVKYNIQSSEDWLNIISHDEKSIEFSIQENITGNARSAQVSLSTTGINKVLTIVQRAANITTTTESLTFEYEASSATIEFEADASWKATCSEWIGLSNTAGTAGKSTLTVDVPKNASAKPRNGFVYLTIDGNNRVEIPIIQNGIVFDLSTQELLFGSFADSKSITVTSNDNWIVTSCPEWVEINALSGNGDAVLTVTVKENNSIHQLNGKIEFSTADNVISRTVNVSQSAKTIDFDAPTLSFPYNEESKEFSFETDGSWSVGIDGDWFNVDKLAGVGNATLTVHVQENMSTSDRYGTILLTIAGEQYNINVYQESKYLTISSSAFDFTSSIGNTNISISSNTGWTATVKDNPNWLMVMPSSGFGDANIRIGVSENKTPYERKGEVLVDIPGVHTYIINITQAGKYLRADCASVDFTSAGGTISFNVITDGTYEVKKSGTWFGYTKSGDTISVIAPANNTGAKREGEITLTLTNLTEGESTVVIPVNQY